MDNSLICSGKSKSLLRTNKDNYENLRFTSRKKRCYAYDRRHETR